MDCSAMTIDAGARAPRPHPADPGPALEAAFRRIERDAMAGLPLLNPALRVQAVGFERWRGHWLGALVTPWFINLVLVPARGESWVPVAEGERRFVRFAAGDFAFLGGFEPEVGEFQACSLISPPGDFESQADAVETARQALRLLHQPPAVPAGGCGSTREPAAQPPAEPPPPPPPVPPPRRVFMFGRAA
jgi:[NiFe] hydrogenase assembly HybE family chaperone